MKLSGEGTLLRIFLGESDRFEHHALYDVIVRKARESGMAGATVLRGVEGFGARSRVIHTAKILQLSEDLPMIIEIVDTEEKIRGFIPIVDDLFEKVGGGGMITQEHVDVIKYTQGKSQQVPAT
jgi:PII-like signaling protein